MTDYGNPDIYRSPRYDAGIAEALRASAESQMWDDWDLSGLLTDVPFGYAAKMGSKYGIFCSTGTAGLHASLMSLELLPGDEVIVPCMTFIRSVTPLVHLGLIPVLADVDPLTGNISAEGILQSIGPKTRAVIVVHMWGIPSDMSAIKKVCDSRGILIIEDFSHAHFSEHVNGTIASFGDVSFASLQRKKTISVGEGGLIVTNNEDTYFRLRQITSPGSFKGTPNYNEFSGFGLNLRMSPFSCVVARELLARADKIVSARDHTAAEFSRILQQFSDYVLPPVVPDYAKLVSAYGYKPSLTSNTTLDKLRAGNSTGLWRFGSFSYDHIMSSPFWKKSRAHFPFAQQISPKAQESYPGYEKYISGRISLAVPTVDAEYWTDAVREQWSNDLKKRLEI